MTFTDHLGELRRRLIRCLGALAVGAALSFWQIDRIVAFLTEAAPQLYVMKPAEAFMIYVKIALWSGAVLTSPILAWEFWAFLVPAFTKREKRTLMLFVPASVLLFLAGLVDAVAGGGGLISLPAYLLAGLPPHLATATNKCSSTFGTLLATVRYLRRGKLHRQSAALSVACALAGSWYCCSWPKWDWSHQPG